MISQQATDATVTVAKGMEIFEFSVEEGDFCEKIGGVIEVIFFNKFMHETVYEFWISADMGADADPFVTKTKASGKIVVNAGEEYFVQL